MRYRTLGKTGLSVSEIGFGAEWLERHNTEECVATIRKAEELGINILDCWMAEPNVRSNIGIALKGSREKWILQGHLGSTWQNGQYVRTRDLKKVKPAFEDLLNRLQTDYIDLGMIHFVDDVSEYHEIMNGDFLQYALHLKKQGTIRHIGISTHNPEVGKLAATSGIIEMMLFSLNPAFDMLPASSDMTVMFAEKYDDSLNGISRDREELYRICEENEVAINVMKGFAGGRLFNAKASPFGVALTPVQCIHYALTRPAVCAIMAGFDSPEHVVEAVSYETASESEKDYATVLANAPRNAYSMGQCTYCGHCAPCPLKIDVAMVNKLYDLAVMQEEVPASLNAHFHALKANAFQCIGCGKCEERCPFHVKVVEKMKQARILFGETQKTDVRSC